MDYFNIKKEIIRGIIVITIAREKKLNALNQETLSELENIIDSSIRNKSIKGIVITGEGEKAFIAGADIKEFSDYTPVQGLKMVENGHRVFKKIEESSKPIIAAVNGFALGGGCELAMACHIRIATKNALFGQPEANLGIIPGYGGTQRLTQLIGKSKALELMMTCGTIDAIQAEKAGLINYIVEKEDLLDKAIEILEIIKLKSSYAISSIIKSVNAFYDSNTDGFFVEREEFTRCVRSEDFKEGTSAFLEKRKPNFN